VKTAVFWIGSGLIALMIEAAGTSETLINFYTEQKLEGSHIVTRRHDRLKSHPTCGLITVFLHSLFSLSLFVKRCD
jgi:hypothetical protein